MKKYLLLLGLFFLLPTTAQAMELTSSTLYNDANLQAYWRMEDNVNDSKATNNGTAFNLTYETGMFNTSSVYNGTTSYVTVPTTTAVSPTTAGTIAFWIKSNGSTDRSPLQNFNATVNTSGWLFYINGAGKMEFWLAKNSGDYSYPNITRPTGTTILTTSTWYFVAGTWDGTNVSLYINGAVESSTAWAYSAAYSTATKFRMGCDNTNSTNGDFFNGNLDDISIFNRALSSKEITALYAAYVEPEIPTTTPTTTTYSTNDSNNFLVIGICLLILVILAVIDFIRRTFNFNSRN